MADRRRRPAWLRNRLSPALMGVNKQIHHEASEFLYKNEFVFRDAFAFNCFAEQIGLRNIQQLRIVRIQYLAHYNKRVRAAAVACFTTIKLATSLEAFHMHPGDSTPQYYIEHTHTSEADHFFQLASS